MVRNIKATNITLTEAITSYINSKLDYLERHIVDKSGDSISVSVEVGKTTRHHDKGEVFRAEINLSFGRELLRAESYSEDLYAALDKVKDEMEREIKSYKEKRDDLIRFGGREAKKEIHELFEK